MGKKTHSGQRERRKKERREQEMQMRRMRWTRFFLVVRGILLLYFFFFFCQREQQSSKIVYLAAGAFAIFAFCRSLKETWMYGKRAGNPSLEGNKTERDTQKEPYSDRTELRDKKSARWVLGCRCVASAFFGLLVVAANYKMYVSGSVASIGWTIVILWAAAFVVAGEILEFLYHFSLRRTEIGKPAETVYPLGMFLLCLALIAALDISLLFSCVYPGNVCSDSLGQIKQVIYGNYSNHHPFYHTQLIRLFYTLGMSLFHDINAAIACFHVFQILLLAASFAHAVATAREGGLSKRGSWLLFAWFWLLPMHITFSLTMWKVYGACYREIEFILNLEIINVTWYQSGEARTVEATCSQNASLANRQRNL